jgi:hypothetical protein
MTIQAIIFSKDRPLQLHATLASFALNATDAAIVQIHVLCKASNEAYARGYAQVAEELGGQLQINWVQESDFKVDLLAVMQAPRSSSRRRRLWDRLTLRHPRLRSDHLLFLVDDNLFIRPFCLQQIADSLDAYPDAIGFSLRVGRNTTSCYSMQCEQPLPAFEPAPPGLSFQWSGQVGDFGYPLEVSSSVYRSADLIPLLRSLPYNNPNRLEQGLSAASGLFKRRLPTLLCFEQSVAFCAPVNKVQSVLDNRSGAQEEYSSEALNTLFLDGYRVTVSALSKFVPSAAHVEIELPLSRP